MPFPMPPIPPAGVQGTLGGLVPSLVGLQTVTGQGTREDATCKKSRRAGGRWLPWACSELTQNTHLAGFGEEKARLALSLVSPGWSWCLFTAVAQVPVLAVSPLARGWGKGSLLVP